MRAAATRARPIGGLREPRSRPRPPRPRRGRLLPAAGPRLPARRSPQSDRAASNPRRRRRPVPPAADSRRPSRGGRSPPQRSWARRPRPSTTSNAGRPRSTGASSRPPIAGTPRQLRKPSPQRPLRPHRPRLRGPRRDHGPVPGPTELRVDQCGGPRPRLGDRDGGQPRDRHVGPVLRAQELVGHGAGARVRSRCSCFRSRRPRQGRSRGKIAVAAPSAGVSAANSPRRRMGSRYQAGRYALPDGFMSVWVRPGLRALTVTPRPSRRTGAACCARRLGLDRRVGRHHCGLVERRARKGQPDDASRAASGPRVTDKLRQG